MKKILAIIIIIFIFSAIYNYNDPSIAKNMVGEYVFDSLSSYSSALTKEQYYLFDKMTLKIHSDGTFEFSKEIPDHGINGQWEVIHAAEYTHIMLRPSSGFSLQTSRCCDSENNIRIYYRLTTLTSFVDVTIAFKKTKHSIP
jgi:hypothetical protein